jgi:hypothetical protein
LCALLYITVLRASKYVAVTNTSNRTSITGGVLINIPKNSTPELWCDFYGIDISEGVAIIYKAVNNKYGSNRTTNQYPGGFLYTPGTTPFAPDWDGGIKECGGGLHGSPRPFMALKFHTEATKFIACPVLLSDISVHPHGDYPEKVKFRGCCAPCYEVDIDGNRI